MSCVVKPFLQYLNSVWRERFADHFLCSGPSSSTGSVRHPSPFISIGSAQTKSSSSSPSPPVQSGSDSSSSQMVLSIFKPPSSPLVLTSSKLLLPLMICPPSLPLPPPLPKPFSPSAPPFLALFSPSAPLFTVPFLDQHWASDSPAQPRGVNSSAPHQTSRPVAPPRPVEQSTPPWILPPSAPLRTVHLGLTSLCLHHGLPNLTLLPALTLPPKRLPAH